MGGGSARRGRPMGDGPIGFVRCRIGESGTAGERVPKIAASGDGPIAIE